MNEQIDEPKTTKKGIPIVLFIIIVFIAIAGFFILGPKNNTNNSSEESFTNEASPTVEGASDTSEVSTEVKIITIEAGSYYYNPKEIRVKKGERIQIQLTSKDIMHDFNIDELSVKSPIAKSGETTSVEFSADQRGEFEYYCSVGKHRQLGQVGKLIIE